jgi:2-dehydro-3-deoxyphosphogluconate aldolase/(4S)-4-hydroxy-2-oxoglutarate aldolase
MNNAARRKDFRVNIREIVDLAPVIPVLTIALVQHAVPLARALTAGGLRVIEVSLRTPAALASIEAMRKDVPEAIVGVGALRRAVDFAAAHRAGAQFGVTPGLTADLAAAARGARFPVLPGVMTPKEILEARALGFETLQLFPALQAGGVAMLCELAQAFAEVVYCPAGGITRESAPDYLALPNVVCVGGSWLAPPALVAAGDWRGIEARARDASALRKS